MPENFKTLCGSSSPRQEYGFGDEDLIYVSLLGFVRKNSNIRHISFKEKRKFNGNLTRRPPARLIALYKVFKVSVKPFQRLGGV